MATRQKRILLTLDGSERSLQTARYAGEEELFKGKKIVLFHVFNSIPDAYYDLEKEPKSVKVVTHVRSWEAQRKKNIRNYMEEAKQLLVAAGHAETAVEINIQNRRKGVTRDILIEAQKGYDALLTRRRGASALKNIIVGSVTANLLEKLSFMPLLIAGRKPVGRKILVAVDGSACATRAVGFVAEMLGGLPGYKIRLLHVIRGGPDTQFADFEEDGFDETGPLFTAAINILTAAGIDPKAISTRTITGVRSRAGAIVNAAEKGEWDTIVVGRRGLTDLSDFFMGRVSNKVLHVGRMHTVWIIT